MKKLHFILTAALFFTACTKEENTVINIFHTNDIQGFYWARNYVENDNKETGGFAVLKEMLDKQEAPFLLFDSGETFSKTQEGQIGKLDGAVTLMNKIKYTAATLSAADFALGWESMEPALAKAEFPFVVSNIQNSDGTQTQALKKYLIIERNGVKIAVLGLISREDFPLNRRNAALKVTDEIQTLKELVPAVKEEGADIVIVLSSLGFDLGPGKKKTDEKTLAEEVPDIDLILGGNGDLSEEGYEKISDVYVSRSRPMFLEVEKIALTFNKVKQFIAYNHEEIVLDEDTYGADTELLEAVAEIRKAVKANTGRRITALAEPLPNYSDKLSPLGVYTADCIRRWGSQDIGIINSDLFLTDFREGIVTAVDLQNSIPFNDRVMFVKMRGDEFKNALEHTLAIKNNWPQTAGVNITYDPSQPLGKKIGRITLNGTPLKDDAIYTISTSDHIVAGGMGHNEFLNVFEFKNTDRPVREIVRWCLYRQKNVTAPKTDQWKAVK
jgi:2',3'-cyclic-nucleotide 2'-phosphodiesterase/3'-nucleotidase